MTCVLYVCVCRGNVLIDSTGNDAKCVVVMIVESKTVTKMNLQILYSFTVVGICHHRCRCCGRQNIFQRIITGKWDVTSSSHGAAAGGGRGSGNDVNQFETMPNYGFRIYSLKWFLRLMFKIANAVFVCCAVLGKRLQMTSIITFVYSVHIFYIKSTVDICVAITDANGVLFKYCNN